MAHSLSPHSASKEDRVRPWQRAGDELHQLVGGGGDVQTGISLDRFPMGNHRANRSRLIAVKVKGQDHLMITYLLGQPSY